MVCVVAIVALGVWAWLSFDLPLNIGDSAIGVRVSNQCELPVRANAGDSEGVALSKLEERPITIVRGDSTRISLIANAAYEPTRYLLAFRIGDEPPQVHEFDLDLLQESLVTVTVTTGCAAEFPEAP